VVLYAEPHKVINCVIRRIAIKVMNLAVSYTRRQFAQMLTETAAQINRKRNLGCKFVVYSFAFRHIVLPALT